MSRVVRQVVDWMRPERPWRPRVDDMRFQGFNLSDVDQALTDACWRLNVRPIGHPNHSYTGRSRGVAVRRRDGSCCWLKVGGVYSRDNWYYEGEIEAFSITSVPKPCVIEHVTWVDGDTSWFAILTTHAGQTAETSPWAGFGPSKITDAWIAELKAALDRLAQVPSSRMTVHSPDHVSRLLDENYGLKMTIDCDRWRTIHGDMHWSNLMVPQLSIIDWESFGAGPPGLDAAWLIAYSCRDEKLVARLEQAFASQFQTKAERMILLYAADMVRNAAIVEWLDPSLADPLAGMIDRRLQEL
jgi:hypothetical protein